MPDPRPLTRRRDENAADTETLARLGVVDEPPDPAPPPEPEPPAEPDPEQQAALTAAIVDAGVDPDTLADLTPRQMSAVARLLNGKSTMIK
ncbi:hypothetical protein [Streptomyces sp. CC224B]|uniref:hypothetical protein n=1 Tax=Streptomyces sp. CC224B TaxID=3044571 RepID=UPI0024A92470|nr:hypothetical protein [Streptomyces sp. CC224B]